MRSCRPRLKVQAPRAATARARPRRSRRARRSSSSSARERARARVPCAARRPTSTASSAGSSAASTAPRRAQLARHQEVHEGLLPRRRRPLGYNCPVVQNGLDGRGSPSRRRHAEAVRLLQVTPVDPTARDNAYLHAVLLDYGRGGNRRYDPTRGLRDYLVQVDPANPTSPRQGLLRGRPGAAWRPTSSSSSATAAG